LIRYNLINGSGKTSLPCGSAWCKHSQVGIDIYVNEPLETTLADIVTFLERNRLPFALIGGQASSLRGEERVTADIDLIVLVEIDQALALLPEFAATNFRPLFADVAEVIQRAFILPLRHQLTQIKVDLAIALSGFERQAIARAERLVFAGCRVPVATAEDLIIMKALAGRPRDDDDVRGMFVAQGDRLDWNYCQNMADELGRSIDVDLLRRITELRDSTIG
jgi:hypothetical protein